MPNTRKILYTKPMKTKKKFNVTIKATIEKTLQVEAEDEGSAVEEAHERFSVLNDSYEENYEEECTACEEVN